MRSGPSVLHQQHSKTCERRSTPASTREPLASFLAAYGKNLVVAAKNACKTPLIGVILRENQGVRTLLTPIEALKHFTNSAMDSTIVWFEPYLRRLRH